MLSRLYEAYFCARSLWPHRSLPRPFAVFSQARSGSQLLRGLLNQHPRLWCEGEVMLRFVQTRWPRMLFPAAYLEGLASRSSPTVYGCLLRQSQLWRCCPDPQGFPAELARRGWQLIHLQRRNRLRLALSFLRAEALQRWHLERGSRAGGERPTIDPRALLDYLRWTDQARAFEEEALSRVVALKLVYEEDLESQSSHQATADRVFEFLGLPSAPVQAPLRRTGEGQLPDLVSNWQQLVDVLRGTSYAQELSELWTSP